MGIHPHLCPLRPIPAFLSPFIFTVMMQLYSFVHPHSACLHTPCSYAPSVFAVYSGLVSVKLNTDPCPGRSTSFCAAVGSIGFSQRQSVRSSKISPAVTFPTAAAVPTLP